MKHLTLAVVITTCDRPQLVARAVASAMDQSCAPDQVVLVDNGREMVGSAGIPTGVDVVRTPARGGVSQARNIGAVIATTDLVIFLDDDDQLDYHYVQSMLRVRRQSSKWCLCGRLVDATSDLPLAGKSLQLPVSRMAALRRNPGGGGSGLCVERLPFLRAGGFDVRLESAEDNDIAIRFRAVLQRVPDAIVRVDTEHGQTRLSDRAAVWRGRRSLLRKHVPSRVVRFALHLDYALRSLLASVRP